MHLDVKDMVCFTPHLVLTLMTLVLASKNNCSGLKIAAAQQETAFRRKRYGLLYPKFSAEFNDLNTRF